MNILFIEDELSKQRYVLKFLKEKHIENITTVNSVMSGMIKLKQEKYDYLLLDMSLPLYDFNGEDEDNNEFDAFGGLEILNEVQRRGMVVKVVVITAFDIIEDSTRRLDLEQLDIQMKDNYPSNYLGCIHYDLSSLEWKMELSNLILGEKIV